MLRMLGFGFVLAAVFLFNLSERPVSRSDDARERLLSMFSACAEAAKAKPGPCQLYGKIQYVENFPDVTVKVVENFPDLKVKVVENFADKPGLWKLVQNFPDYKIKMVENFPDIKVQFVENFPGCGK